MISNALRVNPSIARTAQAVTVLTTVLWGWAPVTSLAQRSAPVPPPAPPAKEAQQEVVKLDAVTVAGSYIRRTEVEKALPVTVVSSNEIDLRGATQTSDLLTMLPEVGNLPHNESDSGPTQARGAFAAISLRGLPAQNTVILLDGRRVAPHPLSSQELGSPSLHTNVNILPSRGLERIEVLRDGASSLYGSDAVAGVVNFVTRRDLRGTELSLRFSETEYRDGVEVGATLMHGLEFSRQRGRVVLVADFYHRQALYLRDRPFSADADLTSQAPPPWSVSADTTFNLRLGSSEYGAFQLGAVADTHPQYGTITAFRGARPDGVPATVAATNGNFFVTPRADGSVGFAPTAPARAATGPGHDYYWNPNTYRVIQPQSARLNLQTNLEYDLYARVTAFANLSYYQARTHTYREPGSYAQSVDGYLIIPTTNPFNPFGDRYWSRTGAPNADGTPRLTGTPSAVSITNKRFPDLATRAATITHAAYRGVAGLRGRLAGSWSWEAALLWSEGRGEDSEAGWARRSLLAAAINQSDPARAFNPFTRTFAVENGTLVVKGDYRNPASVISTFHAPFVRHGTAKLGSGDFRATGDVLRLWGGNVVSAACGGEYRYEAFDDSRVPFAGLNPAGSGLDPMTNDFAGISPYADSHGHRHVAAVYVETLLPVMGGKFTRPLLRSLEFSTSARYESYSDCGETTKPKYAVSWKPAAWFAVRGSRNWGFRAPDLSQYYASARIDSGNFTDFYRRDVTLLPTDGTSPRRSVNSSSGNPDLRPETSAGKSAGLVIDIPRIKGLSFSVDYWEIRQKDVANSGNPMSDDNLALRAATQAALAAGQKIDAIDLGSGTAKYRGDPAVERLPVTAADQKFFADYNAGRAPVDQRAVVGAISLVRLNDSNKSRQFINGFDFNGHYRFLPTALGAFSLNTTWTYLNDFHGYRSANSLRLEYRGNFNLNAAPVWRGSTTIAWRRGLWGAGLGFYYTGRYAEPYGSTTQTTWESLGRPAYIQPVFTNGIYQYWYVVHDAKSYHLSITYRGAKEARFLKHTTLRLGITNLLDAKPPLSPYSVHGYEVSLYNGMARGRTYSLELKRRL